MLRPVTISTAACAALLLCGACMPWRRDRVAPAQSARVARARADIALAAGEGDVEAVLRYLAPGSRLVVGSDSFDLREAVARFGGQLRPGAAPELYFEPRRLRQCDRWLYESGGRLGLTAFAPGEVPAGRRYRYAMAWTVDSAGAPLVESVALIRTWYRGHPRIAGCRPTAAELLEQRRIGLVVMPGAGAVGFGGAQGGIEGTMRDRALVPGRYGAWAGYPEAGTSSSAVVGAWYRATDHLRIEAVGATATTTTTTSGVDTVGFTAVGIDLRQRWVAAAAAYDWNFLRVGIGPAFMREAWRVSSDSILTDPSGAPAGVLHVADATAQQGRVGLFTHAALTVPFSGHLFAELRGYVLWLPGTSSPPAFGFASTRAPARTAGFGAALGVAF